MCRWAALSLRSLGQFRAKDFLFAEIFFFCTAVSPRAGTNTNLKAVPSQKVPTGVFQCDDGKDRSAVHAPHAGAITHVLVVDGGILRAGLGWLIRYHHAVAKSLPVFQILGIQISFHPDKMLGRSQAITIGAALMVGAASHDLRHVL